jgi:NAD(P)-dependent dehydrogenase (short-subunit alcohol dehydrogenase family)
MSTTPSKIAFITGGNRGLGFETARELGEAGIAVVLGARDVKKGEEAAAKLGKKGIKAYAIRFDATDPKSFDEAYAYFDRKYGRLDILVNNAGINFEPIGAPNTAPTISPQKLRETFDTNFFAVVELTQKLLPLLRKSPAGRIVNLSSILGSLALHADPGSRIAGVKNLAYDSSKTALNQFTVHLAAALRDTKIKVNSAHPGWVKTELGGENAPLEVAEGGRTSFQLATLGEDGPTGGFFHLGEPLPW